MVEVSTKGDSFVLAFSQAEFNELGLDPNKDYKVVKVDKGVWVLLEKGRKIEEEADELEKKVIAILKKKDLRDRVEGKFEKYLNEGELKKFNEMLKQGRIVKFKLSKKYKKAIYKLKEELEEKEKKKEEVMEEKPFGEYSLEKDGFIVVRNEERAKKLSNELRERIKKNEVKGIKSFDGNFYIIETKLYEKRANDLLNFLQKKKSAYFSEVSKSLNIPRMLVKVVFEFLKDEGSVIEKRKELYKIIE